MATTIRQKLLHLAYPLLMLSGKFRKDAVLFNKRNLPPSKPFHKLGFHLTNGQQLSLSQFEGKKILIVNTASDCGFTRQYGELQELYDNYKQNLEIIAFPSNEFKEQEQGTDEDIAQFCQINFGVRFPIAKKTIVRRSQQQHPVFAWLTQSASNGWNNKAPEWNFSKYLVNEEGVLTHYFGPHVSPLSKEVIEAIR
jgi:glutathione peroxidase